MSTIKVTNLQNASAASPAIVLDANSRATLNGLSYPTEGSLSGRNRIINGAMVVDARNAGASVTFNDGIYPVDRFRGNSNVSGKATAQRSTVAPSGFSNSLLITSSSAYTVAAGDVASLMTSIEGFNVSDLAWGTASAISVTLSFWVRSSLTGTFGGAIQNSANTRSYPFSYTISAANTWEQKSVVILGDTTGTWLTDNSVGMRVIWSIGTGSNFAATAGSWTAGNIVTCTGSTSVIGTNGATFYITGVQLEAGSVATPFERRSYGQELALCQRYYTFDGGLYVKYNASSTANGGLVFFPVTFRATPTVIISQNPAPGQVAANNITTKKFGFEFTTSNNYCAFDYTANAEL